MCRFVRKSGMSWMSILTGSGKKMRTGTLFSLSIGLGELEPETQYCFLKNDVARGRVLCVRFSVKGNINDARILSVNGCDFEEVAANTDDLTEDGQLSLPPWLSERQGVGPGEHHRGKHTRKRTDHDYVEQRLGYIFPAVKNIDQILCARDIEKEISQYARACTPKQNEKRFRIWLLTYLCSGRNAWSLSPNYSRIGHWSRLDKGRKYGVKAKGKYVRTGFPSTSEMVKACEDGYGKCVCVGKTMRKIYTEAMKNYFG